MSVDIELLPEQATMPQTAVALREPQADLTAGGAEPPGGEILAAKAEAPDALADEAERLAHALMQSAYVALGVGDRIGHAGARYAEIGVAVKLTHAAAALTQALNRRQGRGVTQHVVVERVQVQGGQAIIGAVAPGGGRGGHGGAK